jgi:hypothetical protein
VPVSVTATEANALTLTPIANLSQTGALVVGKPLHPIGARIVLRFVVFPDDPLLFEHTARVVRYLEDPPATGVEFDPMPPEVHARLQAILARARAQADSPRQRRARRLLLDAQDLTTLRLDK